MKVLDKVTLVICDTVNYGQAVNSLQKSLAQIKPARTIFFTDIEIDLRAKGLDVDVIQIPTITSKNGYSEFIIKKLGPYIETEFVLVTQWDAWVLNGNSWQDKFYDFSYTGSPWLYSDGRNVGNGGFSLRSKKLQDALHSDDFIKVCDPEDEAISRLYGHYLEENYGITFADEELADQFAFELRTPVYDTFGFHGFFHQPFRKTIMFTREGAIGDVLALEPVMHHFHKKGYKVVLNTLEQCFNFFQQHYFKVHHPMEMDKRIMYKEYNLDMAYEVQPKKLHLDSYYEMCDVPVEERELVNPKLTLNFDARLGRLFKKYVVIHNDIRPQASRNIEGIDWESVTSYLKDKGYDSIQIGIGEHLQIPGALYMQTPTAPMLMWLIGGADFFIGIDSAPSHVAVAMNTPAIIFYGSVNPEYLIPDMKNVIPIHNHKYNVCEKPFCWHNDITCVGVECYISKTEPPCSNFKTSDVLQAIDNTIKKIDYEQELLRS